MVSVVFSPNRIDVTKHLQTNVNLCWWLDVPCMLTGSMMNTGNRESSV
jgi:hypothetical protein